MYYQRVPMFLATVLLAAVAHSAPPMSIHVDATQASRNLLRARLVVPAQPGELTLYYPKWIPGQHGPSGRIADLTGVTFSAGGEMVRWTRHDEDMFAFHVTVPTGATELEANVEFLMPPATEGLDSSASSTAQLAVIYWNQLLLYPQGSVIQQEEIKASIRLPAEWQAACALPIEKQDADGTIHYQTVSLERLCDSPLLCGRYFQEIAIGPKDGAQHWLCLAADSQAALEILPSIKTSYDQLVAEGLALFGARHYDSYRFLCSLSDRVPLTGLEHHDSSDNRVPERSLAEAGKHDWYADLLPHEFVHSWNGKFRRPAAMVVDDFQRPVHTRLLWVYEGLTQYLGMVLAARSGLWTPETAREHFARVAEWSQNQRGRDWRSLEDTAVAAQNLYGSRSDGAARRRGVDFYDEGVLIWLDADTLIREKSGGEKSLDDFCQAFFGGDSGPPSVEPYQLEDIVSALGKVTPHDWQAFFDERVSRAGSPPPLDGIERGGWKLVYGPERSKTLESWETDNKCIDLTASLGLLLKDDGTVIDAIPGKPAEQAGVAPGMRVFAVSRRKWSPQIMRTAVTRTKGGGEPLTLILENAGYVDSATIKYDGGDAYPKLERSAGTPDRLSDILKSKESVSAGSR